MDTNEMPVMDHDLIKEVVLKAADLLKEFYVFPDVGEKMGESIKNKFENGKYDSYTDIKEFCKEVTVDLRDISRDLHIFLFFSPDEALEVTAQKGLLPDDEKKKIVELTLLNNQRKNFGFQKVEVLEGNVGYLKMQYFPSIKDGAETCYGAMRFLSNSDAMIIDLRENGGGDDLISLLSSYFFPPEKILLSGCFNRASNSIEYQWTMPDIPGKHLPDMDLFILAGPKTFSAAEDFAYSLQQLKRVVVIGESTKGGAHPVDVFIVKGSILMQISIGYSINPITKTNWEGVGVQPDIKVSAEDALHTAYLLALTSLAKKTKDDMVKQELDSLIERNQSKQNWTT